jgi:hypothetical protein
MLSLMEGENCEGRHVGYVLSLENEPISSTGLFTKCNGSSQQFCVFTAVWMVSQR